MQMNTLHTNMQARESSIHDTGCMPVTSKGCGMQFYCLAKPVSSATSARGTRQLYPGTRMRGSVLVTALLHGQRQTSCLCQKFH